VNWIGCFEPNGFPLRHPGRNVMTDSGSPKGTKYSLKPPFELRVSVFGALKGLLGKPGDSESSSSSHYRRGRFRKSLGHWQKKNYINRSWMAKVGMRNNQDPVTQDCSLERWGATNGNDLSTVKAQDFKTRKNMGYPRPKLR
jgi:hypothetical protein